MAESPGLRNRREQMVGCDHHQLCAGPATGLPSPLCAGGRRVGRTPQFPSVTWSGIPAVILSSCATSCKSLHLHRPSF